MTDAERKLTMDSSGFVVLADKVPSVIQEIRYHSTYNFIGERINGYEEPVALITKEAARALLAVSNEVNVKGYRLKIFDTYRPACAVRHFVMWGIEDLDLKMKPYFYPTLEKQELFRQGFIASKSSHSRGSAIDLTLLDMTASDLFAAYQRGDIDGAYIWESVKSQLIDHDGTQIISSAEAAELGGLTAAFVKLPVDFF